MHKIVGSPERSRGGGVPLKQMGDPKATASLWGEVAERPNALAWKASRGDEPLEGSNPSLSVLGTGDSIQVSQPKIEACARLRLEHCVTRNDVPMQSAREGRAASIVRVDYNIRKL
jgi:hypothetical protein